MEREKKKHPTSSLLSPIKALGAKEARHVTRSHYNHSSPPDDYYKKDPSVSLHAGRQTACAHMTILLHKC